MWLRVQYSRVGVSQQQIYPASPMIVWRIISGAIEIETDFLIQALQMTLYTQFVACLFTLA